MGEKEKLRELEKKYREDLENIKIFNELITCYIESNLKSDLEKGLALLNTSRDTFKDEPEYYKIASYLYMSMEHVEMSQELAISAAKKSVEIDPKNPKWYGLLGFVYWWYGDIENAIELSEKGLELSGEGETKQYLSAIKGNLAYFYAEANREKEKALRLAEEAFEQEKSASKMDTLGYVKTRFAESEKDLEGIQELFLEAKKEKDANIKQIDKHLQELFEKKEKYAEKGKN